MFINSVIVIVNTIEVSVLVESHLQLCEQELGRNNDVFEDCEISADAVGSAQFCQRQVHLIQTTAEESGQLAYIDIDIFFIPILNLSDDTYFVTKALSFLRLSVPGFSLGTSPLFGTGFFSFLLRAVLMVSALCLGNN